jgi:hypothetical protein
MQSIVVSALVCGLVAACSEQKQALDTWIHADTGSYGAAISPDGKHLLTGEIGGFARVWDLQNNKVKYSVQHEDGDEGGIIGADFSAQGEVLVTIEQNSIARWALASGRLTGYWQWPNLSDVAVSADGRHALIGSKDNQAVYFDMVDGKMRYVFPHHEKVTSVALSKDGRFALTGSDDWHASLWDLSNGEHLWSKNLKYKISLVALSDDGELALAGAYIRRSHLRDARHGQPGVAPRRGQDDAGVGRFFRRQSNPGDRQGRQGHRYLGREQRRAPRNLETARQAQGAARLGHHSRSQARHQRAHPDLRILFRHRPALGHQLTFAAMVAVSPTL